MARKPKPPAADPAPEGPDLLGQMLDMYAAEADRVFEVPGLPGRFKVKPFSFAEMLELEREEFPEDQRMIITIIRTLTYENSDPVFEENATTVQKLSYGPMGPIVAKLFEHVSGAFDLDKAKNA